MDRAAPGSFLSHCDIREGQFMSLLELFGLVSFQLECSKHHIRCNQTHTLIQPQLYLFTMVFSQNIMCVNLFAHSSLVISGLRLEVVLSCWSECGLCVCRSCWRGDWCDWVPYHFRTFRLQMLCGSVQLQETFNCLLGFKMQIVRQMLKMDLTERRWWNEYASRTGFPEGKFIALSCFRRFTGVFN